MKNALKFMKANSLTLAVTLPLLAAGCSNLERSRDLANPNVRAEVTAMQVCSNCHGVDGNPTSPNFPRLAGQQADYIVAQLENFRSHRRADPAGYQYMWGLSRSLTDSQIRGLADYYAKQTPKLEEVKANETKVADGKKIFEEGLPEKEAPPCFSCHGPQAQGMATFPRLANQHKGYLLTQLHIFQETNWRPDTPMTQVTHKMSHEEMDAVAEYLQVFPESKEPAAPVQP